MGRHGTHSWKDHTQKDRIVLCLLKRSYERKHIAPTFNEIFKRQLSGEGLSRGLGIDALDGQYQEIKNGGPGYRIYQEVRDASQTSIEREYREYFDSIRNAISRLGLDIEVRTSALEKARRVNKVQRRVRLRRASPASTILSDVHPPSSTNIHNEVVRPHLQKFAYNPGHLSAQKNASLPDRVTNSKPDRTTNPIPPKTSQDNHRSSVGQAHPVLMFRATSTINRFRSRRFPNPNIQIPPPPVFGTPEYRDIIMPHLERDKIYPSQFISLAQNPHNAIRRIELSRSEDIEKKMFLVIFDFKDVQNDAKRRFGEGSGPHLVRRLFMNNEISDLPDGYKGAGEWVCYGSIECEPIAILDSALAINLAKALRRFKNGDTSALLQISQNLNVVPDEWKELLAYKLLCHYCGRLIVPGKGTADYRLLIRTIHEGTTEALNCFISSHSRSEVDTSDAEWRPVSDQDSFVDDDDDDKGGGGGTTNEEMTTTKTSTEDHPFRGPSPQKPPGALQEDHTTSIVAKLNALASHTPPKHYAQACQTQKTSHPHPEDRGSPVDKNVEIIEIDSEPEIRVLEELSTPAARTPLSYCPAAPQAQDAHILPSIEVDESTFSHMAGGTIFPRRRRVISDDDDDEREATSSPWFGTHLRLPIPMRSLSIQDPAM